MRINVLCIAILLSVVLPAAGCLGTVGQTAESGDDHAWYSPKAYRTCPERYACR